MPSLTSHLLYFVMRNRHLLQFRLKREAWDWNTSILSFRQECEESAKRARMPDGIQVSPVAIAGLPAGLSAEWIRPFATVRDPARNDAVIFYTHGGGYVSGSCSDHRAFVAKIVKWSGVGALLFEYRLAPEHPCPAALEDTLAAYGWLLAQGVSPSCVAIVGESAGGGLCLATLLALPAAAVAISPMTDLKLTGESHRTKASKCLSPEGMATVCSKYYAGENDPALPWISPLYGNLAGLPPMLLYVGEYEIWLDDSTRFAAKAQAAGVDVTLRVGEGMIHGYPLLAPLFPEATRAMNEICAFIKTRLVRDTE